MKIKLSEIKVADLDSGSVIMLNEFVRTARKYGADLKMQYPDIVKRAFKHASVTDNPDLIVMSMRLRKHMARYVMEANLEKPSFNLYSEVAH